MNSESAKPATWRYMGFWDRLIASLLDNLLLLVVIVPLTLATYGMDYLLNPEPVQGPVDLLLTYVLPIVFVLAFWVAWQATPGKMLFGGIIVDATTGARPRPWQWAVRYLGYFVSLLPLGLGFIWVGIDPRKQGWHDKLARTVVIHRGTRGPLADLSPAPRN